MHYDSCFSWYKNKSFSKENVIKSYNIEKNKEFDILAYEFDVMKKSFYNNIIIPIKDNNENEYVMFLPPYSIMHWKLIKEQGWLNTALEFRMYVYQQISTLDHVVLHDFQSYDLINSLNKYRDTSHYSEKINKLILKDIGNKKFIQNKKQLLDNNLKIINYIHEIK